MGRRLDAEGVRAELHRIEVHGGDLLLGVVVFEFEGRDPLLELRGHEFGLADDGAAVADRIARKEVLGQLLRDGRAAALRGVLQQQGLHGHTRQRRNVDARVGAETDVLGRNERRDDGRNLMPGQPDVKRRIRRIEVGVLHIGAVLHEEGSDHLAVLGVDLRGEVAAGILQLLERGHAAEHAEDREHQHQRHERKGCESRVPDPFYRFRADTRLFFLSHTTIFATKIRNFHLLLLTFHFNPPEAARLCSRSA